MTTFLDRLMGRDTARTARTARKAVYGGPALVAYQNDPPLSIMGQDWHQRAKLYLAAYKVGWFYKAGSRISRDFSNLEWSLAYEDTEGDNTEDIVAPANNIPWERLDPLEQFLRLSEHPNPYQSGRAFKQQQMIRLDFTGRALTWLDGGDGGGLPTAWYGISPERMVPVRDKQGSLVGWVLDPDKPSGPTATFTADEILVTEYPGTDEHPVGVVESVYAHVPLSRQLPQHTSDVLATGGRLAGMAWPKERTLNEDEFADAQRAWRSVTSDPNAARRLLLFPEPMEYQQGAATPQEIGITDLAELSRTEILTAFPIAPYMVGVPIEAGLNSGESLRYVRMEYWEGTQHPRVEVWEDSFQQHLIPRYEGAIGRPLDFDIEEPDLDDGPSIVEKVGAFRSLVSAGFDPKESVAKVGLDDIKWDGLPDLINPAKQAEAAAAAATAQNDGLRVVAGDTNKRDPSNIQQTIAGKAIVTRDETIGREFPGLQATVSEFLLDQRARIIADIEATMPASKAERATKADEPWWDAEKENRLLRERLTQIYLAIGDDALHAVADNMDRVITKRQVNRALDEMLAASGVRITDINETTRRTIAETLQEGVRRGYSIPQLTRGVTSEGFGGVQGALMANGVNVWDDLRAETIARTETMNAYNDSALRGYGELGARGVQAIDGDKDEECARRDGQVFSIDDALSIADHPNGTLDWAPLT